MHPTPQPRLATGASPAPDGALDERSARDDARHLTGIGPAAAGSIAIAAKAIIVKLA